MRGEEGSLGWRDGVCCVRGVIGIMKKERRVFMWGMWFYLVEKSYGMNMLRCGIMGEWGNLEEGRKKMLNNKGSVIYGRRFGKMWIRKNDGVRDWRLV